MLHGVCRSDCCWCRDVGLVLCLYPAAVTVTALPGTTMDSHGHLRTRSMSPTSSSLHRGFKSATQLAEVRLHDRDWPRQAQRGRGPV